ncbi:MAG: hypothetical protein JKY48_20645 [Flavobacteriales bacterium]|nr:hypothetical protein [Flavobacteriales bacterium]
MHSLGDKEVDFILDDIQTRGIVLPELQDDLLDHICCIIENEITIEDNFYVFYETVLPRFFKESLEEIQIETNNLLKFKNFYIMKKLLKFSGIATVVFTLLGAIFKSFHFTGTGILIMLGGFTFSFLFLPLLILIKLKDDESKTDKLIFSFGLLLTIFMCIGLVFKLMHWPFATGLMLYSTMAFTFLYVPLYFITRVKRPELKFNTTVNSVLMIACGGIFYSLFDLSYSHQFSTNMAENHIVMHENSEMIMISNQRLFLSEQENTTAQELHAISDNLNEQLETVINWIVKTGSTLELAEQLVQLDQRLGSYNLRIDKLQVNKLKPIRAEINKLNQVNPVLAMNVLARMQQQLVVNENYYLTSIFNQH